MTANPDIVAIKNLEVGYSSGRKVGNIVFGPLNLRISHAEMVAVIGRNGVGKSTLLRTIAGIQSRVKGQISICGKDTLDISLKDMAMMVSFVATDSFQAFQISVNEMVSLGRFPYTGWLGKLNHIDKAKITEAIEQVGIGSLIHKKIHQISDGERQKVMIARALAQDTPVIILDEPTAFLDLPSRYDILRILNELTLKSNKTVLFSTHDLSIAMDIADKIWLMADNEVHEGAPEDLLIRKVFRKLFLNSPAEFDPKTSAFRFKREFRDQIEIQGDKKFRLLTKKAMERIGLQVVDQDGQFIINVKEVNGKPEWEIIWEKHEVFFQSVYDLVAYLKPIYR